MKYNLKKIGDIIRKERKASGFRSQDSLLEKLNDSQSICRNTLSEIENGKTDHYDCKFLFALCEIFGCELGYLLGEYECKTGRNTDIVKETRLSQNAVEKIINLTTMQKHILSKLIENPEFVNMIDKIAALSDKEKIASAQIDLIIDNMKRGLSGKKINKYSKDYDLFEKSMIYSLSTLFTNMICKITDTKL